MCPAAGGVTGRRLPLAASALAVAARAALPPGYDEELYCPPGYCLRPKEVVPGFVGPRAAFHECLGAEGDPVRKPEAWGHRLGERQRDELLGRGFHRGGCDAVVDQQGAGEEGTCAGEGQAKPAVHAAFYLWYGNPEVDGRWIHWNHKVLPHWDKRVDAQHEKFDWRPPEEPHSPFMPERGPYSCSDSATLHAQFRELASAGVDSAMCSWWGKKDFDGKRDDADSGANTDVLIPKVLEAAQAAGVGISFHIEPYGGRTPDTFLEDLRYIHQEYGPHPGVWRDPARGLPLFWLYDVSVQHSKKDAKAWRRVLDSVRGTPLDGVFMCLWIGERQGADDASFVVEAGFDGAYTYFAAAGFTPGSNPASWPRAVEELKKLGKMFVPAVGPGYDDTRIRPWNAHNVRERRGGGYYDSMWAKALAAGPAAVSVTSYNEWGEGTQIEPARPYTSPKGLRHLDYLPDPPGFYLNRTREWADKYRASACAG